MTREELLKIAKPILFNTNMVKAILDDRKTATRRKIDIDISNQFDVEKDGKTVLAYMNPKTGDWYKPIEICKYQPGDILYVRETWGWKPCWDCVMDTEKYGCPYEYERIYNWKKGEYGCYRYKASMKFGEELSVDTWYPSIHMPKEAARIFLKVTDVRVERLQDITEEQALKEGVKPIEGLHYRFTARDIFSGIWQGTIKRQDIRRYGWDANPWVQAINFEKLES